MQSTPLKALLAIAALAGVIMLEACAASIPRADLNATTAALEKRQSSFVVTAATGQTGVTFNDIECSSTIYPGTTDNGSGCLYDVAEACAGALNKYAGNLNAWAGNPDGPGIPYNYYGNYYGTSSNVYCTVFFANPIYFEAVEAEHFLETWDSYQTGLAVAQALENDNLIQICVELWDSEDDVAFAGSIFVGVGWNAPYSLDPNTAVAYLEGCDSRF